MKNCLASWEELTDERAGIDESLLTIRASLPSSFPFAGSTPPRDFTFDYSYWSFDSEAPNFATNPKVYSDLGVSVLNNAWSGYNCCR
jgi:hypothetical protein